MSSYSCQGNITIKRLRNGDSLFISFTYDKPLYQGVNPTTGEISPKWTDTPDNQPTIVPKVTSVRGNTVVRSEHVWQYNGSQLLFTGETSGDWRTDSTGRFQMNVGTSTNAGALKIIKDLANKDAVANGQLTYKCSVAVSGQTYSVSKSIDIVIQNIGATAYYGAILASVSTLDNDNSTSKLTTKLISGTSNVDSYIVKWWKDDELYANFKADDDSDRKYITVDRSDIDGSQLFIAEFYLNSNDTTPVARAGVYIIDSLDEFIMVFYYTSTATDVSPSNSVTVKGKVINTRTNTEVSLGTDAVWKCYVMDGSDWSVIRGPIAENEVTITTSDTDRNNKESDVEVVGEVTFS